MLPSNDGRTCLIFLDDVVRFCLPFIFAGLGYESFEAYAVKFTRDAEMELRGDAGEGLVEKVARGVKSRKRGEPVRFVYDRRMPTRCCDISSAGSASTGTISASAVRVTTT